MTNRARTWLTQWGPMLPLLIAEATIWAGFGALLPILPIYFTQHGVSLPMLGVVVAAWPAARLIGEPLFGRIADSAPRRTMMVIGLFAAAFFAVAPLFVVDLGVVALILTRIGAGLSASAYDPAARGYLVDANPPERQGETFGLYGAAQMGGLMLGPAIGGIAAGLTGNPTTPFWLASIFVFAAGVLVWARVKEVPHPAKPATGDGVDGAPAAAEDAGRPARLRNRVLVAALVLGVGSYFAGGAYEVVWSLYLTSLGASLGMIGLTFFTFALPILVLSPVMGRFIDHEGGFLALVIGTVGIGVCGLLYALVPSVWCRRPRPRRGHGVRGRPAGTVPARREVVTRRSLVHRPGPVRRGRHGRDDHRLAERRVPRRDRPAAAVRRHRGRVAAHARRRARHRPAAPLRRPPARSPRARGGRGDGRVGP